MTSRKFFVLATAVMLMGSMVVASVYFKRWWLKRAPISATQIALAENGVETNSEWTPIIRRVGKFEMALVPSGCFPMGSDDEQLVEASKSCDRYYGVYGCDEDFVREQPAHEVCLTKPFWIALTPVTNKQYGVDLNTEDVVAGFQSPSSPHGIVTWEQAVVFCEERDARLPTEAEWEFAARGPDALLYPFGNEYAIEKVTLRKISPPSVGEKLEGASWVGALDMSGGISEWVADWYGPYPIEPQADPLGPADGKYKIARGGSWFAHASYVVRTSYREPLDPAYATTTVGFRCAKDFGQ
jgi:formylglycine-generating enzyme required for sulfatase activity